MVKLHKTYHGKTASQIMREADIRPTGIWWQHRGQDHQLLLGEKFEMAYGWMRHCLEINKGVVVVARLQTTAAICKKMAALAAECVLRNRNVSR